MAPARLGGSRRNHQIARMIALDCAAAGEGPSLRTGSAYVVVGGAVPPSRALRLRRRTGSLSAGLSTPSAVATKTPYACID